MNDADFNKKLGDLLEQIGSLPSSEREKLTQLADETKDRQARMKKTVSELQDSLDYLRLSIKYIMFDLEATRRENAYLRKLLEKQADAGGGETNENQGGEDR